MTILSALSTALDAADRAIATRRAAGAGGNRAGGPWPLTVPVPHDQPVQLSGENRLITYADSVATIPVIFGVWSKILRALTTTELGVYRTLPGTDKLERVHGTNLEELLHKPGPRKGLVDLLQWWFNPYLVEGNGITAKFREGGPGTLPTNLIPLDWRYMSALAVPGGPVEQWISYQIGEPRAIDPTEVVHLAWCSPNGSEIGPSPLRALGTSIKLDDAAQRYQSASFDNGSRPSGAMVLPKDAATSPDERAEMREEVKKLHQGVDNAFRLAVLFGGIEWRPMSFSAVEAELMGTRDVVRDEVMIAYDMRRGALIEPKTPVKGLLDDVLRDFERSLTVHTTLLQNVIQRQLIDPEPEWASERYVTRFDLSRLVRGTYRQELESATYSYVNGLTARDESRDRVDLPAVDPPGTKPLVPHAQLQPGRDGRTLPPSDETDPSSPAADAVPSVPTSSTQ
ncbi:MAG: phage portal protein [Solirubrobacteraceae bacterium]|nr:phage portal protein [Solirubrobacteraceae bacterium]